MLVITKGLHLNISLQHNFRYLALHLFDVKESLLLAFFQTTWISKAVETKLSPIKGRMAYKEQFLPLDRLVLLLHS